MQPLVFNKKSWHYWLATVPGSMYTWREAKDLCDYIWAVWWGFFRVIFMVTVAVGCVGAVYDFGMWIYFWIKAGHVTSPGFGAVLISCILAAGVILGIGHLAKKMRWDRIFYVELSLTPSFLSAAYVALKDKMCFEVKFE